MYITFARAARAGASACLAKSEVVLAASVQHTSPVMDQILPCPPEGYLRVYRIRDSGKRLELVHRTPVGGVPGALAPFRGRLLAGVGATLRIYEAGKKKLLRKCEHRKLPTHIATLHTLGDRIYVGDLQARPWPCTPPLLIIACVPHLHCLFAILAAFSLMAAGGALLGGTCRRAPGPAHPLLVGRLPPALAPLMRHRPIPAHIGEGAY